MPYQYIIEKHKYYSLTRLSHLTARTNDKIKLAAATRYGIHTDRLDEKTMVGVCCERETQKSSLTVTHFVGFSHLTFPPMFLPRR